MCGIAGFVDFSCRSNLSILKSMTDVLHHRGPDDSDYYLQNNSQYQVGLGHRRLSILDLSEHGRQPMQFQHLTLTFNGEVYNFKEIRLELEQLGFSFTTQTDTEVILIAYYRWGLDAVHKFNGMFTLVFYDSSKSELVVIRDRAGVKPLYWYFDNELFLFGSELKSLQEHPKFTKQLNLDSVALYFQFGYIPQPHCIFKNSFKLQAGHYLTVDLASKGISTQKYWDVFDCYKQPKLDISEVEAIAETEKILQSACNYRMVADVPVGVFLSGGYDSATITALLQSQRSERLKTFTIGFEQNDFNEAPYAKQIAQHLGTDHTECYCTERDALDIIPKIPMILDEPMADSSIIPTVLVSKLARKDVKVSLSADGGDEIFGGYNKYTKIGSYKWLLHLPVPIRQLLSRFIEAFVLGKKNIVTQRVPADHLEKLLGVLGCGQSMQMLKIFSSLISQREVQQIFPNAHFMQTSFETSLQGHWLDQILALDYKTFQLDDILVKVDRATMSVSLEGREPLLDYRVIDFVARLDPSLKIKNGDNKFLLKSIAHKYLPKAMMDRPKRGFEIPIGTWLGGNLNSYIDQYLSVQQLEQNGLYNFESVTAIRDQFLRNEGGANINKVWSLLVFQMWCHQWL